MLHTELLGHLCSCFLRSLLESMYCPCEFWVTILFLFSQNFLALNQLRNRSGKSVWSNVSHRDCLKLLTFESAWYSRHCPNQQLINYCSNQIIFQANPSDFLTLPQWQNRPRKGDCIMTHRMFLNFSTASWDPCSITAKVRTEGVNKNFLLWNVFKEL
jgi:hypothetical protein